MSRTNHPRPPRRSLRRHATDVAFHLDNALRAINHVHGLARDPRTRAIAEGLRTELVTAKNTSQAVILAAGREQARQENPR